jgi:putative effector of murein hydrolase LrgA (UPF0299 family)
MTKQRFFVPQMISISINLFNYVTSLSEDVLSIQVSASISIISVQLHTLHLLQCIQQFGLLSTCVLQQKKFTVCFQQI